MKKCDPRESI